MAHMRAYRMPKALRKQDRPLTPQTGSDPAGPDSRCSLTVRAQDTADPNISR